MVSVDTVIVDSHLVLPEGITRKNIVIDDGRIKKLTNDLPACGAKINGSGLVAIPGVIDTHVHYGVYSPIEKAAVTESHAAAVGGVTTMMRMLRLGGSYRSMLASHLEESRNAHHIDYAIHASIFNDRQVREMGFCKENGVTSFKIYMNLGSEIGDVYMDMPPNSSSLVQARVEVDDATVRNVVKTAADLKCPVLVHAEDYEMCSCGISEAKKNNQDGLDAWSKSRSPEFEASAITRVSEYGREFGCTVYFVHIGSARALQQIRKERMKGTRIYVETCPHYLTLSYENERGYLAKVMPPIRTINDNNEIWSALANSEIDTIGTDHVANRLSLKLGGSDVWGALAGFPGIGTSLPILLSEGVNKKRITLERLAEITSGNSARIFSLSSKGFLHPGSDADITMINLKLERRVSSELLGGFSDYTVYEGRKLTGWPVKTIVRGHLVMEDFQVVGRPGLGKMATRKVGNVNELSGIANQPHI